MFDVEGLTETILVNDIFVSGLGRIEDVGSGNFRFTFYTFQKSTVFNDRRRQKIITARIIMPMREAMLGSNATMYAANGLEGIVSNVMIDRRQH